MFFFIQQNDKENDEEEFIKPNNNTKIKRLSKLKSVSRRVLGSCN